MEIGISGCGHRFSEGLLTADGVPISKSTAIKVLGCKDEDFDSYMLNYANGKEQGANGIIRFPDFNLARIQLFCLKMATANA